MKKLSALFMLVSAALTAQPVHDVNAPHFPVSLKEAIDYALEHNENIITDKLEIAYQQQYKKGATEIPKTVIAYTQGQFNSAYKYDNSFNVTQQIPFPGVFAAHNSVANSYIKSSRYKLEADKADLIFQVKSTYYSLLYHYSVQKLLEREDSIYASFAAAGKIKYEKGGGSLLEKTTAETKVMEIKNRILENEEDINSFQIQLQTLLNHDQQVDVMVQDLTGAPLNMVVDSASLAKHPFLRSLAQQTDASRKNKTLELYHILPDFVFGYFNLSIYGPANFGNGDYFLTRQNRMQGFTVGLNVPLWFYPQEAKIKAAEISTKVAESNYNYNLTVFEGQFKQGYTLFLKYQNSIHYYKSSALTNSKVIIEQALKNYTSGEISYVDYLAVVSSALEIETNYLNVINQNNQIVMKLEYLMTK